MKRIARLLTVVCLLMAFIHSVQAQTKAQLQTLDSALVVLHRQAMFNGVVLIAENGKIRYKKALGVQDIDTRKPLQTSSSFNLASVSKQFMAMMVMILYEKGKLSYSDPVQKHISSFPYPQVTIRHLLTHTSGLPEYFDLAQRYTHVLDTLTNDKLLQLLVTHQPAVLFAPGEKWEYCNTGYVVLGSVIEKASGMSVASFFRKQIAEPLQLKDTYVYHFKMKEKTVPKNRVIGFHRENGREVLDDLMRFDGVIGDGNVYSSAEDLLKWEQALYTETLVKTKTSQEAFTPVQLTNGTTYPYGFGWSIEEGGKVLAHTGSWVGFLNEIHRNVSRKHTYIILSSSGDFTARKVVKEILTGKTPKLPVTQLISHIRLIDGTGTPARLASVRLKDDKIWEVGALTPFVQETVVDGKGYVLAPGFIDSHSHHGSGLEEHPDAIAPLNQGITTIVVGQDGGGDPVDSLTELIQRHPIAVNMATYTGHSMLRLKAMGVRGLYRMARAEELQKMKTLLQSELSKGSLGLATGLEYESAFFSNRDEVIELAKVAGQAGGRYMSHIRSEDIGLEDALDEIITIGREANIPVQISHVKIAKKDKWASSSLLLSQLQKARLEGIDITADCYPYDFWLSTMRVLFPKKDFSNPTSAEFAVNQLFDPEKSVVMAFAANEQYAGKTVSRIAELRNEKPSVTLMNLIAQAADYESKNPDAEGRVEGIMGKSMSDEDVVNFLSWTHTNICSDGFGSSSGHPRGYGAFTRVLGKYVREMKIMSLETAISKMTGLTAEHLGIKKRGLVAPGYYADLVLFNPETVQDNASIQQSDALSTGIEKVWVNGQVVYENQKTTGLYPGMFVKR